MVGCQYSALEAEDVTVRSLDLDDPVTSRRPVHVCASSCVKQHGPNQPPAFGTGRSLEWKVASHVFNWKIESSSLNQRD
ncbi:hypothetical protein F444_07630 [Phytophthora nicotianae P1976]|uniref:Uncharacterized protein n=1 Tax=Phytophthora nicotianae P1976 TaxID=1317066 RepID=A0A081AE36_PHYNI|nr:hypothetical protein F444_07630 [Phytophthora nicotianae P1976]